MMTFGRGAVVWSTIILLSVCPVPSVSGASGVSGGSGDSGASGRILTLGEAEELALRQNPAIRMAGESVRRAQAGVSAGRSAMLPSLSASGSYSHNIEKMVMFLPEAFGGGSAEIGSDHSYSLSLNLAQPIFLGFAGIAGYRQAQTQHDIARQEFSRTRHDLLLSVREAYLGAVLARGLVRVHEEAVAQAESSLVQVQRRYDVGQVSGFDLLRAQVQLSNTRPQLVSAESNRRLADARLGVVLGMEAGVTPVPADTLVEFRSPWLDRPLEELEGTAMQNRPDLVISEKTQRMASQGVRLSRSGLYPSLFAFATTQWQAQWDEGRPQDHPRTTMAGVRLSWTLWDSWRTPSAVQQARADLRRARLASEAVKDAARLEVQAAHEKLRAAEVNLLSQGETVEQAAEALRLSRIMYDNGSATQLDVLGAQLALTTSRMQYATSLYEYHIAHAQLEKALGLIGPQEGD